MDNFEEIVGELTDLDEYVPVDVKLVNDAAISSGFLYHEGECNCETNVVVFSFKLFGDQEDINIAVLPGTPLYEAFMDGRFQRKFERKAAEGA